MGALSSNGLYPEHYGLAIACHVGAGVRCGCSLRRSLERRASSVRRPAGLCHHYKLQGRSPARRWWISPYPRIFASRILTRAEFP